MELLSNLLDKDDINGPSTGRFPRSNKSFSTDYALFKISLFLTTENQGDKKKFICDLDTLVKQLGKEEISALYPVLENISQERVQYRKEFSRILPKVLSLIHSFNNPDFQEVLPRILDPLLSSSSEILLNLLASFEEIIKSISANNRSSWLITTILRIIHDSDEEKIEIGIKMLSKTLSLLNPEVCENFIYPEVVSLSQGNSSQKANSLFLIPYIYQCSVTEELKEKLLSLFLELCNDQDITVKESAIRSFPQLFALCDDSLVIQKLQPTFKEFFKDPNDKIRHAVCLQLGPLIYKSKAPFPHNLLELYLKLAKSVPVNKELQNHCAFYFPAVFEKMGKESWNLVGDTFIYLARNPETRKTCAASIHHIFSIIEDSNEDLFKVFLELLTDKGFRSVVIKNSHLVFKLLKTDSKNLALSTLVTIAKDKNFRIKLQLAEVIAKIGCLLPALQCYLQVWPVCKALSLDSVGCVRHQAMKEIGLCAVYIISEIPDYSNEVIKDLKKFCQSAKSDHRLVFASACFQLVDLVEFEAAFGDDFLGLCQDKVSSVRIACARAVKRVSSLRRFWVDIKENLKTDLDGDVRREIIGDNPENTEQCFAGQSQVLIKAPAIRSRTNEKRFDEIWDMNSSEKCFEFMVHDFRPKFEGGN